MLVTLTVFILNYYGDGGVFIFHLTLILFYINGDIIIDGHFFIFDVAFNFTPLSKVQVLQLLGVNYSIFTHAI